MSDIVNNNNEKTQMNVKETMAITVVLTVNDKQMLVLAKKSDPVHVWVYFFLQHPEKNTFYQVYVDGNRLIPFTPTDVTEFAKYIVEYHYDEMVKNYQEISSEQEFGERLLKVVDSAEVEATISTRNKPLCPIGYSFSMDITFNEEFVKNYMARCDRSTLRGHFTNNTLQIRGGAGR